MHVEISISLELRSLHIHGRDWRVVEGLLKVDRYATEQSLKGLSQYGVKWLLGIGEGRIEKDIAHCDKFHLLYEIGSGNCIINKLGKETHHIC